MSQFEEYRKKVMETYESKRVAGELSTNLMNPKRANLRDECLHVYSESPTDKDDKTLRDFFGPRGNQADYYQIIRNTSAEKFRTLANFLENPSINTATKNVELLAWLIDHQPRPFQFNYHPDNHAAERLPESPQGSPTDLVPSDDGNKRPDVPTNTPTDADGAEGSETATPPKNRRNWVPKVIMFVAFASVVILGAIFVLKPEYMVWTGEKYQRVFFWTSIANKQIVAFDKHTLVNFQRITRPDTLTQQDIYSTWYTKIAQDSIEFYTDSAKHPIHESKLLKPMTEYIWIKWVRDRHH